MYSFLRHPDYETWACQNASFEKIMRRGVCGGLRKVHCAIWVTAWSQALSYKQMSHRKRSAPLLTKWTACTVHHQFWSACSRLSQHLSDPLGMLRSKPQVTLGIRKVIALPSSGLKRLLGLTHQSAASSLSFSGSIGHHLVQVEQTFLEVLRVPVLSKSQCPAQAHVLQCRKDYRRVSEVKPAGTRRSLGLGPEKQAALSEMGHGAAGPIRDQHYCPTRGRRGARFASRSTTGRVLGRTAAIRVARILASAPMAPGRMTAELMG